MSSGDKIASCHTRKKYEVTELGIMHPEELPTTRLQAGQVGYIACNMKNSSEGAECTYTTVFPSLTRFTISPYWRHTSPCWGTSRTHGRFSADEGYGNILVVLYISHLGLVFVRTQVYAGIFPIDSNDFLKLEESIKRVCKLNLCSLQIDMNFSS